MINAATTPTIPMIMSKFEPLLLLRMFYSSARSLYKDHSDISAYSNRWFCLHHRISWNGFWNHIFNAKPLPLVMAI